MLHQMVMNSRPGMMTEAKSLWQDSTRRLVAHKIGKRRLHKKSFKSYKSKHKPMLTPVRKKKIHSDHLNWTYQQWQSVMCSDESLFQFYMENQSLGCMAQMKL